MSFKETIAKVLDKDTSLGEKIQTLFREQGITIASILTAIGMAIGVLVEALLPGGAAAASGGGEPPPKDEKGLKEWVRSKLKALASLLGKLGIKAAEALPGIIGGIISWILNRAKDVVGWVSQNLWALVVGIGGLIYTYIVMRIYQSGCKSHLIQVLEAVVVTRDQIPHDILSLHHLTL